MKGHPSDDGSRYCGQPRPRAPDKDKDIQCDRSGLALVREKPEQTAENAEMHGYRDDRHRNEPEGV
jgi:hypothetical protein